MRDLVGEIVDNLYEQAEGVTEVTFTKAEVIELIGYVRELRMAREVVWAAEKLLDECPNICMETDGQEEVLRKAIKHYRGE